MSFPFIIDTPVRSADNPSREFVRTALGNPRHLHYFSNDGVAGMPVRQYSNEVFSAIVPVSLAVQAVQQASAVHAPLNLSPDVLWYFIVHEVVEYMCQYSDACAGLFTELPTQLVVAGDKWAGWHELINLVCDSVRSRMTDRAIEIFLPRFLDSSEGEAVVLTALSSVGNAFIMGAGLCPPRYSFGQTTPGGIPKIRLEGSWADWYRLHHQTVELATEFSGLSDYFNDLLPVLEAILETQDGQRDGRTPNEEFWRSMYRYDAGNGTYINGWLTAFFAFLQGSGRAMLKNQSDWRASFENRGTGFRTSPCNLPAHISQTPFVWRNGEGTRRNMIIAAGVTSVDYEIYQDHTLRPRLGLAIAEL